MTCPLTVSGEVMHPLVDAKAPDSQASATTTTPASSITFLISSRNSESFSRSALSRLPTRPGISVAEKIGWRPEA